MNALELARSYGVRFLRKPDGGIRYQAAAAPPPDVVAVLAAAKPDFLRVLAGREAAQDRPDATAPPDCLPRRWAEARDGLRRFVSDGWGDQAALWAGRSKSSTACRRYGPGSTSPAPPFSSETRG